MFLFSLDPFLVRLQFFAERCGLRFLYVFVFDDLGRLVLVSARFRIGDGVKLVHRDLFVT